MQSSSNQVSARDVIAHMLRTAAAPLTIVLYVVFVTLSVLSGPFGTFWTMTLGQRALFWPVVLGASFFSCLRDPGPGHLSLRA